MNKELFELSLQSLRRKKRSSLLLFAVLFLSFAFAIVSLTVTGSMQKTNQEYRCDIYGSWYGAVPNGQEGDEEFLREREWLRELGTTQSCGTIGAGVGSIGVMDETFLEIGRISLLTGCFPESAGEIAMEADLLSALGYGYTLGQEITLTVNLSAVKEDDSTITVPVEQTYTLCGILREYTSRWTRGIANSAMPPLNSAMITPESMETLCDAAGAVLEEISEGQKLSLCEPLPQYYFAVISGSEDKMQEQVNEYLSGTRTEALEKAVTVNTPAFSSDEEAIGNFYTVLILVVTVLAVVCIYAIRIQDETRQLAIFRSIGITKRQLCAMLFYETVCLAVPAMIFGVGAGALGTWGLLKAAVYSGSTPVHLAVSPILLAVTAVLWVLAVLAARIVVFLVAIRAPLTGRFHMARKKARLYQNLRRGMIAALSVLLCATTVFTIAESLDPIHMIRHYDGLLDYWVQDKGWASFSTELSYDLFEKGSSEELYYPFVGRTISKDTAESLREIPGIANAWGWGLDFVRLDFDGMEDVPLADDYQDFFYNVYRGKDLPFGIGPYDKEALVVHLNIVEAGDWQGFIDFDTVDRDKFQSGDTVILNFPLDPNGKFIPLSDPEGYYAAEYIAPEATVHENGGMTFITKTVYRTDATYDDPGLSVGDTVKITIGTPENYTTTEVEVGGISYRTPEIPIESGVYDPLNYPYTVICSEGFLNKLLDSLGEGVAWQEFRQREPYGYQLIDIYTDPSVDPFSTEAVLAEISARENLRVIPLWETKETEIQLNVQRLILILTGGGCMALVLLLILWNTLAMEAERKKRNIGIQQALGMSKKQLRLRQLKTAMSRGALGALFGWLVYFVYYIVQFIWMSLNGYAFLVNFTNGSSSGGAQFQESETAYSVWELLRDKLLTITRYWGDWQVFLPLTVLCIMLILTISWLANRRLTKEDLMAKLRDEH